MSEIDKAINAIQKQHGKRAIHFLGEDADESVEVLSTGSLYLDWALAVGGWPKGRIIEIMGPESSGKTTMLLTAMAKAQAQGDMVAFVDAEHALTLRWARKCGVRTHGKSLLLSQPSWGEQALDIVLALVETGEVGLIGVDSVAALIPKKVLLGDMGKDHVAIQARMMSQAVGKLVNAVSVSNCVLIFINQLRDKIGVIWGAKSDSPGGRALKFFASARVNVGIIQKIKRGEKVIGNKIRLRVVKNKVGDPFREVDTAIYFEEGLDLAGEVLAVATKYGYIEKEKNTYTFVPKDIRMGTSRNAARVWLVDHPKILSRLEGKVRVKLEKELTEQFERGGEEEEEEE